MNSRDMIVFPVRHVFEQKTEGHAQVSWHFLWILRSYMGRSVMLYSLPPILHKRTIGRKNRFQFEPEVQFPRLARSTMYKRTNTLAL